MQAAASGVAPTDIDAVLAEHSVPVLVDCFTPGCGPCAALGAVLDEVAGDLQGQLAIQKIDVAAHPEVAKRFGLRGVPALLLFKDGQLKASRVGAASRTQLLTWLSIHGSV